MTPYKDIVDINMPGTYAFEAVAMRCFGSGAIGWRLYDLFLLLSVGIAATMLAGRGKRFAGIFGGVLFALVHLQDGIAQGGQRNLLMAALLLWAYVVLFRAQDAQKRGGMTLLASIILGCTITIKPVLLPLALALLCMSAWAAHRRGRNPWPVLWAGTLGLALPSAATLMWLQRAGALQAFLHVCTGLLPLHARLGRQTLPYLMSHCLSPISAIAGLWLLLWIVSKPSFSTERSQLLVGILGTVFAYVAEGKGYPYQRYPLLAILLVTIGIDVTRALYGTGAARVTALCMCGLSCFLLAPRYAWLTRSFSAQTPFQTALSKDLTRFGTPAQLNNEVQCLDTFGGCVNSLYDLRIRQSTGFLYDCYLFSRKSEASERYRAAFWTAFQGSKPRIVVETNQFCFGDARGFRKLETWPLLAETLTENYDMKSAWKSPVLQHWWNRKEEPTEFRLYLRKH